MNRLFFILLISFISSCDAPFEADKKAEESYLVDQRKLPQENPDTAYQENPLDLVLGDKVINEALSEFRENNYSDFTQVSKKDLGQHSLLYNVASMGDGFFAINQKKQYSHARRFSGILQSGREKVKKYVVVNDFEIIDQQRDTEGMTVLYGNFGNVNTFWKTNNEVRLIRYDHELNEVWRFMPKSDPFPIEGLNIGSHGEQTTIHVNVLVGCHICGYTLKLGIDDSGKCISLCEVQRNGVPKELDKKLILDMFTDSTHNINYALCKR